MTLKDVTFVQDDSISQFLHTRGDQIWKVPVKEMVDTLERFVAELAQ